MADPTPELDPGAQKVLTFAEEEAGRFNHNYIGTEHLLLGLLRVEDGLAATALGSLGVDLDKVRSAVEFIIGRGERRVMGDIGLTPRAKKVMALSHDESRRLGSDQVRTEYILLGLIREGEGIAAGVLESLGVSLERARLAVIELLGAPDRAGRAAEEKPAPHTRATWEYLALPTEMHDGVAHIAASRGGSDSLAELAGNPVEKVIETLAGDGWQLAGIDSSTQTKAGLGPLYILKRRKAD